MQTRGIGLFFLLSLLATLACDSNPTPRTPAVDAGPENTTITWYGGVQALLAKNCIQCHTADGIGPFPLDEYTTASATAPALVEATANNIMPPWLAHDTEDCTPTLPWKEDIRLSPEDKNMLAQWAAAGAPMGDPANALPLPSPPNITLENPTVTMSYEQPFEIAGEQDLFECFVLDPKIQRKQWITDVSVTTSNSKVAHHALVFLDPLGESRALATDGHFPCYSNPEVSDVSLAGAWTPGGVPFRIPTEGGMPIPAGALVVVQMHYHPVPGVTEVDTTTVALKTTDVQPQFDALG